MPFNRSEQTENRKPESRMKQSARTVKPEQAAERPASLNGISKKP